MCGRYFVDKRILSTLKKYSYDIDEIISHDVYPGDKAPVILYDQGYYAVTKKWGYDNPHGRPHINARAESVLNRVTFKDDFKKRRCIIPCRHFYEWDHSKQKISFAYRNGHVMYMAGFYNLKDQFVIITTAANASMKPFHDRMPLLIDAIDLKDYFNDDKCYSLLEKEMPALKHSLAYEQLSLFGEEYEK